jgi:predicted flap endonuclease-1-like 5' DNA nuclease
MTLKEKVENMDRLVLTGKFVEAVEQFFHPEAIAHSAHADRKSGKAAKIESLKTFFNGIRQINHIKLHSYAVGDEVTMSEFTFDFTSIYGSPVLWHEVIRRRWKDGLVYDEKYFTAEQTDVYTPIAQTEITADSAGMTRIAAKYESPVPPPPLYLLKPEDIVYTRPKKAMVMPDFVPQAAGSASPAAESEPVLDNIVTETERIQVVIEQEMEETMERHLHFEPVMEQEGAEIESVENVEIQAVKPIELRAGGEHIMPTVTEIETDTPLQRTDDLKKIEGIGPKIEQILNDSGIRTFKQLAESDADSIKELLLSAGPRFRMHDPATWMQQAELAAKADWATLETLQKALKGGRTAK